MAIQYPADCNSSRKKMEYLHRAQELLRLLHNSFVTWRDDGFTLAQYNELPVQIKNKYPYKVKISDVDWDDFIEKEWTQRRDKIFRQISVQKGNLFESTTWSIDVGEI